MVQSPTFYDKAIPNLRTTSVTVLEIKSHIESKKGKTGYFLLLSRCDRKSTFQRLLKLVLQYY